MALLWLDGFESYGTTISTGTAGRPAPTGVVARRYSIVDNDNLRIQEGRFSGRSLYFRYSLGESLRTPSLTTDTTLIVGAAVCRRDVDAQYIHRLFDAGTLGINIQLPTNSTDLIVHKGTSELQRVYADIRQNRWYFIELKVVTHSTTGSYEVRVNGKTVAQDTDIDTTVSGGDGYYSQVGFHTTNLLGSIFQIDDLYICDGSGSLNNNFLGNKRVVTLRPNADHTTNFTTVEPVGAHYPTVADEECDDDTTYVEGTSGDKDLYEHEILPTGFNTIQGIEVNTQVRETDVTAYNVITIVRSNGTEYPDAGQAVGESAYTSRRRILEVDPNTSVAWVKSAVDSAEFGLEAD